MNSLPDHEHERLVQLLAPLGGVEPVVLTRTRKKQRPRAAGLFVAAAFMVALVVLSIAVAATWGPLSGIGAADHPRTPNDMVSPGSAADLRHNELPAGGTVDQIGKQLLREARLMGALPDGRRVYAIPTSKGKLCIALTATANMQAGAESCADPLDRTRPITMTILRNDPEGQTVVWGVTMDGVTTVSFRAGGKPVTVPVNHNFYLWQGSPDTPTDAISPARVTFTDGSTAPAR